MMRPLVLILLLSWPWAAVAVSAQTPERIKALRADAESGDARAQYFMGKFLTESDPVEATRWFRKAAEQGQRNAQTSMGFAYLEGRGVAKDEAEAARWYRQAAEQGEGLAQWQLAWMSQEGRGMPANQDEALKWFEAVIATEAAEAKPGEATPMANMAKPRIAYIYSSRSMVYDLGFEVPEDPALGFYWLSRAAQLNPVHIDSLTSRARNLSAEQRTDAERHILEWATAPGHGGPESFAPALAALHAAAKLFQVPDLKTDD